MPPGSTWLTKAMQESCCCADQMIVPRAADAQKLGSPRSLKMPTSASGEVLAIETDPKARQAFLQNLDALVSTRIPAADVETSQDEVATLEAEARRALDASYGELQQQIMAPEGSSLDQVLSVEGAVSMPKIVSRWHLQISYDRLQFAEDARLVRRPQFVSAFPAALAAVDHDLPTSLRFRVVALPQNRTILTAGVAKWPGFKSYFGKGFGEEEDSWGFQWRAEDGAPADPDSSSPRLSKNDVVCITCDSRRGFSTVSVNGREARTFLVPCGETFVLGATLSTLCVLSIIPE
jgi:hypothetical protein